MEESLMTRTDNRGYVKGFAKHITQPQSRERAGYILRMEEGLE